MPAREGLPIDPIECFPDEQIDWVPENIPHEVGAFTVEGNQFCVYLQPQMTGKDELCVEKFESLLRYLVGGATPTDLIERATREGTIHTYTLHILDQLMESFKQGICLPISCNISVQELSDSFVAHMTDIRDELVRAGKDPNLVALEILESDPIIDQHIPYLTALHALGVQLSIDDFGTGHANTDAVRLLYGSGIPVTVKLDRSLAENGTLLQVVHELRTEFGQNLPLVAEGVRQPRDIRALLAMEHTCIQSFAVGGPAIPLSQVTGRTTKKR